MSIKPKIIAVDDDPVNNEIVANILDKKYEIKTVTSGKECLKMIPSYKPDLILLDIMMPELDGYELCRRLKGNPETCMLRIVLVTAKAMLKERARGYETGADDYIIKPFDDNELLTRVNLHVRLKLLEEENRIKNNLLSFLSHQTQSRWCIISGNAKKLSESSRLVEEDKVLVQEILAVSSQLFMNVNPSPFR